MEGKCPEVDMDGFVDVPFVLLYLEPALQVCFSKHTSLQGYF